MGFNAQAVIRLLNEWQNLFYTPTQQVGSIIDTPCPSVCKNFVTIIQHPVDWLVSKKSSQKESQNSPKYQYYKSVCCKNVKNSSIVFC